MTFTFRDLLWTSEGICHFCQEEPYDKPYLCDECEDRLEVVDAIKTVGDNRMICRYPLYYNEFTRYYIKKFKFHRQKALYRAFGEILYQFCLRHDILTEVDLMLPIPIHESMHRLRGFNQSELLAGYLHQHTAIDCRSDLLIKTKKTKEQNKLSAKERKTNLTNSMSITDPRAIAGKTILLIDDFLTTGETLKTAAEAITPHEPNRIRALTLTSGGRVD